MYICLCFGVRKKIIEDLLASHTDLDVKDIQRLCKAGLGCGTCVEDLKLLVSKHYKSLEEEGKKESAA